MATLFPPLSDTSTSGYARRLAIITLLVVMARLVVLALSPLDLFYDEAQYWYWGQNLAFGYFSKPPLIAVIIAASTAICGDSEACIRAASPVFHGASTMLMFALGTALYSARVGFFAGLGYLLAIAVSASSLLISTDVPLLICWIVGLWAFASYIKAPSLGLALGFGLAIAIGLNAKYAMIYFPLCALLFIGFTSAHRALLKRLDLWLGLAVGLVGFVPNLIWNAQNNFITFDHTGENITGSGLSFSPLSFLEFFGSQFGVAGPILFAAFFFALFKGLRSTKANEDRMLFFFSIPILAILGYQSFQGSANYNWAASAYPALILVTTAIFINRAEGKWIHWNLRFCGVVAILFGLGALATLALRPDHPIVSRTNLEDMYGWAEHADEIARRVDTLDVDTLVFVGRRYAAGFSFYLRDREEELMAFRHPSAAPRNHYEFTRPWNEAAPGERAIIISPGNISPVSGGRLVAVIEADDGEAVFRSNSYLFLVEGAAE
ncbi:MAG: ArnT family glycosyltransferase [Devosiaceae bacterium]